MSGSGCEQADAFKLNLFKDLERNFIHNFELFKEDEEEEEEMFELKLFVKLQFPTSLHPKSFLPKFT